MDVDLATAIQFQNAGRFADAARCYHTLLARQPDYADALHLFGVLHHQNGYFERAVELIGRAVAIRPDVAAYHANLAEAYRAMGQHQEAIDCCKTALRLQSNYPEAANNLGLAFHDLGRFAEAVAQFRAALEMRANFALAQNNLGTSLRELGQIGQALAAYRSAVELDRDLALAHSNLGQLLVDQGQPEEGLTHCQTAVRLQPDFPAAYNNLGNAYRSLERWSEAHGAYDQALGLADPQSKRPKDLAQIHANRGLALFLEGKRGEAFAWFHRAVELAPGDGDMWEYLAKGHDANEDHAAALSCWQKIVELNPDRAAAHNSLGWTLQQEGQFAQAATCFRRALEIQPHFVDAMVNRGGLHEELGEMTDAERCYRQAQTLVPHAPNPLAHLALLLRGKLPETDCDAIRSQLGLCESDWSLPPRSPARGPLLYGLAQVLDAQGKYSQAADCLDQANALAREQRRKEGKGYDPAFHSALVDRMIGGFTPQLFDHLRGAGDDTQAPVFVFGMPRSGTTLVEQVLASHSQVYAAGELRLARNAFESIPALLGRANDMLACLEALDSSAVRQLSRRHLEALSEIIAAIPSVCGASLAEQRRLPQKIVDKMPDNYLYLGLLAILFPRSTFIHVRRDLRDVAVSCWMTNFRSIRWADEGENLASRCRDYQRLMQHWKNALPVPVHEVVYECLVEEFETEAPRLLAACGLEWEAACGSFHQTARPVRTASVTQVRQPLYRKALARWKHYEEDLGDLFAGLPIVEI